MKRFFFVIVILFLVAITIAGCTKSESKYVGKYISEQTVYDMRSMKNVQQVLEIKKDGTWQLSPSSSDGEWKIDKDGIVLYIGKSRIPTLIGQIEGEKLIDRLSGEIYVKQN
jgi:hypothetical protein